MKQILSAANVRFEDIPRLRGLVDDEGRTTVCYNYLCGQCPMRKCRFVHVQAPSVTDKWDTNFCRLIQTGVDYVARNSPDAPGSDQRPPFKKQRTGRK